MNNLTCAIGILAKHREARHWTDEDVAADLVAQLGLDPAGDAKNAAPGPEAEGEAAEDTGTDTDTGTATTSGRRGRAAAAAP